LCLIHCLYFFDNKICLKYYLGIRVLNLSLMITCLIIKKILFLSDVNFFFLLLSKDINMMVKVSLTHRMKPIDYSFFLLPVYICIVVKDPIIKSWRFGISLIDLIHLIFVPVLIQDFRGNYILFIYTNDC
jgi:hypothetical protein